MQVPGKALETEPRKATKIMVAADGSSVPAMNRESPDLSGFFQQHTIHPKKYSVSLKWASNKYSIWRIYYPFLG
jgi:hypothetical protein